MLGVAVLLWCGVCAGKGLGVDYRHCMTCNACVSLRVPSDQHKCIEQALQRDCPVCSEPLFTSTSHYKVSPVFKSPCHPLPCAHHAKELRRRPLLS
jgi:hypothetical protein